MARKRTTLPKDFEAILAAGDLAAMLAVFDSCELDARGGYYKQTALAFRGCPAALARELVARGLDVDAVDSYEVAPLARHVGLVAGRELFETLIDLGADIEATSREGLTALHAAAGSHGSAWAVETLLAHGARIDVARRVGNYTPLTLAVLAASDGATEQVIAAAPKARLLLAAGATVAPEVPELVLKTGRAVEFHRRADRPQPQLDAALAALYEMFGVDPVPARVGHDGSSAIVVTAEGTSARYRELWNLLVPSGGPAATVQGEAIRLTGRIGREILDNGSPNWDDDFRAMTDALTARLGSATTVTDAAELDLLRRRVRTGAFDKEAIDRLTELAVAWVVANPQPQPQPTPAYRR